LRFRRQRLARPVERAERDQAPGELVTEKQVFRRNALHIEGDHGMGRNQGVEQEQIQPRRLAQ